VRANPLTSKLLCAAVAFVTAALLAGCGGDSRDVDGAENEPTSAAASPSASISASESESTSLTEVHPSPSVPGECTPPTSDVTYGPGQATLVVESGPSAGTYQLTTEPQKTDESVYWTGDQLIGNWRGDQEEELPALEVRILNHGDICQGSPIVRIYVFALAYEDNDSTKCTATLDTFTAVAVSGSFTCRGIPRTFGTKDPAAIDASGTFSLGA
jgi:hypothetical protein